MTFHNQNVFPYKVVAVMSEANMLWDAIRFISEERKTMKWNNKIATQKCQVFVIHSAIATVKRFI